MMAAAVLIVRPWPGADATAKRLAVAGYDPLTYPLFDVEPVEWPPPDPASADAILITSANAPRHAGPAMALYRNLPCWCVGHASAAAARAAGMTDVRTGGGDAATTLPLIAKAGHARLLHLSGAQTRPFDPAGMVVTRAIVYRAMPAGDRLGLMALLAERAPVAALVHSPRASERLDALVRGAQRTTLALVAISAAAAEAAGSGWRHVTISVTPDDAGMIAALQRVASR